VLWAGTLVNRLGMFVEPFLALYLSTARHLPLADVGAVLASYGAGSVISQPAGGILADRIGRRATMAAAMLANAAALLGLGYARGLGPIVAATVITGMTIDMYRPAVAALIADLVPAADRARAYGLLFWAVNLGFSASMVIGGTLARTGFTTLFWADAATCALFALLVWQGVPETLPQAAQVSRGGEKTGQESLGTVFRDRLFLKFALLGLLSSCVFMQAFTTLPLAMSRAGLPASAYGIAMAVNGLVIVVAQPVMGAWLGRRDHATVLACGIGFLGLGFGLTSIATTVGEYAACVAIWAVGEILITNVAPVVVAALAPERLRGRYSGVFGMTFSLGYLIAPLAGTRLLAAGRPVLWLCCAAVCAVVAAAQLALGPAIRRRERAAR
jgi:MFS family permease